MRRLQGGKSGSWFVLANVAAMLHQDLALPAREALLSLFVDFFENLVRLFRQFPGRRMPGVRIVNFKPWFFAEN